MKKTIVTKRTSIQLSFTAYSKPTSKQLDHSSDWIKIIQTDPLQGGRLCTAYAQSS